MKTLRRRGEMRRNEMSKVEEVDHFNRDGGPRVPPKHRPSGGERSSETLTKRGHPVKENRDGVRQYGITIERGCANKMDVVEAEANRGTTVLGTEEGVERATLFTWGERSTKAKVGIREEDDRGYGTSPAGSASEPKLRTLENQAQARLG